MSTAVYPATYYPHYCMGYAVLLSPGCPGELFKIASNKSTKFLQDFWIDDVLYTGVFAEQAGLHLHQSDLFPLKIRSGKECRTHNSCVAMHTEGERRTEAETEKLINNYWTLHLHLVPTVWVSKFLKFIFWKKANQAYSYLICAWSLVEQGPLKTRT